jgi:hypothetical protein
MPSRARLRAPDVIAAQVAALCGTGSGPSGEFDRGACTALRWLLEGGPGPLTGAPSASAATARSIVQELAAAEAAMYGPGSHRPDFARGVEHALMWVQFVTETAPCSASGSASAVSGHGPPNVDGM